MNFIKESLISKITKEVSKRQRSYSYYSFFYLSNPIKIGDMVINRVSNWCAYEEEQILPKPFNKLDGKILLTILSSIMDEDFYFYKIVNDKKYKIKMKKDDTLKSEYTKQYN